MPSTYLSPGVYVEEIPPLARPIAGVGTSTAGFLGIVPNELSVPTASITGESIGTGTGSNATFNLGSYPVQTDAGTFQIRVDGKTAKAKLENDDVKKLATAKLDPTPAKNASVTADYALMFMVTKEKIENGAKKEFDLKKYPVVTKDKTFEIRVNGIATPATLSNDSKKRKSTVSFQSPPAADAGIEGDYLILNSTVPTPVGEAKLCTNFGQFTRFFGDFSPDPDHRKLAHAVFGFFNNGGTRCYVARSADGASLTSDLTKCLNAFAGFDEIAIVAAPGITDPAAQELVIDHCEELEDRVAVLDGKQVPDQLTKGNIQECRDSSYSAIYFPWIKVADPTAALLPWGGDGTIFVPPSGHVAGVYAQVDGARGVFKAPANIVIRGALDPQQRLSQADQDGLNPGGVNVIRSFSGNITIWGARTMGGDANGNFRYISTRRYFNYLRESIFEGTQFVVFEPNSPALWARIKRSVSDFLLNEWRSGALFGETPNKAFFVKCDADTNPEQVREAGQVVTEIGVAIVKPAEFVIFRIQQQTGG